MERGDDRHGSHMRGIGTGLSIGVEIGRAITSTGTEDEESTVRTVKKRKKVSSKSASKSEVSLKFDGKPDGVAFNPKHPEGEMGKLSEHKPILVLRDGEYVRRAYYSASDGSDTKWYWYETSISQTDPVVSKLPYVASCSRDADKCVITKRETSMIWDFFDWWNGYKPVNVVGRCDTASRPDPDSKIGDLLVTCTNVAGSCSGSCELFDASGTSQGHSPPASLRAPRAGGATVAGISCGCPK